MTMAADRLRAIHRERMRRLRQAEADAAFWRNLAALGPYSGRHGIRGDRLEPRWPSIPAVLASIPAPRVPSPGERAAQAQSNYGRRRR